MADKRVVIPDDLGTSFELKNKKWGIKLGNGLAPNSQGAISLDPNTIGEAIADAISNSPGTGMGLNSDGKLSVLRSPDVGNLLEVRENGIYYGVVAQQENWYVDSFSGNDNNKGTKDAPLKTLHGLHKKLKNGTYTYNIYLKEGGTYPVMNTDTNEYANLFTHLSAVNAIYIRPYGDIYDGVINSQEQIAGNGGHYHPLAVKDLQRPTIQYSEYIYTYPNGINSVRTPTLFHSSIGRIFFGGVKFDVIGNTYPADYDHLLSIKIRGNRIHFEGCVFNFTRRPTNIWYFPFVYDPVSVSFDNCATENPQNSTIAYCFGETQIVNISFSDTGGFTTTGGANGTTAYEVYSCVNDFIPHLNIDEGGTVFNRLYYNNRLNYIINRNDL